MSKSTALLLIPSDINLKVNKYEYLNICIERSYNAGYMPFTPDIYEMFTETSRVEYADLLFPYANEVILFVDYGMDKLMLRMIERCNAVGKTVIVMWFAEEDSGKCFCTPSQILHEVSRFTGVTVEKLTSRTRKREIVDARFVYFKRARERTRATYSEIGLLVGRDHSSVRHGILEADSTAAVVKLYERCYGKDKGQKASLGNAVHYSSIDPDGTEKKGSLLSHIQVEKSKQEVYPGESPVPKMRAKGLNGSLGSYGPCDPEGDLQRSVGQDKLATTV